MMVNVILTLSPLLIRLVAKTRPHVLCYAADWRSGVDIRSDPCRMPGLMSIAVSTNWKLAGYSLPFQGCIVSSGCSSCVSHDDRTTYGAVGKQRGRLTDVDSDVLASYWLSRPGSIHVAVYSSVAGLGEETRLGCPRWLLVAELDGRRSSPLLCRFPARSSHRCRPGNGPGGLCAQPHVSEQGKATVGPRHRVVTLSSTAWTARLGGKRRINSLGDAQITRFFVDLRSGLYNNRRSL